VIGWLTSKLRNLIEVYCMPCKDGIDLLARRDKALDATKGFNTMGMIVNSRITPKMEAEEAAEKDAMVQVGNPAYLYNEHVKGCNVCKNDPPVGSYSMARSIA
jgi:hypothetical protein